MITSIHFKEPKLTVTPWAEKVEWLKKPLELKPGLNIVFGPNGSGKSTLLTALAHQFHCHQGGHFKLTHTSVGELYGFDKEYKNRGLEVEHDGQLVFYFSPENVVGMAAGHLFESPLPEKDGWLMRLPECIDAEIVPDAKPFWPRWRRA